MRRTNQIIIASLAWLGGLGLALLKVDPIAWWVGLVALVSLVSLIWLKTKMGYLLIGIVFIILGLIRGQAGLMAEAHSITGLIGEKHTISGTVIGEPGWNDDHLYEFYLTDLRVEGRPVTGLLKIKSLTGAILEGQQIELDGKLGRALGRAGAQVWYAKPRIVNFSQPYPIRLKALLTTGLNRTLPNDQAGFVRGLLFGSRSAVPADLESALQRVGLTHIVAVSGYNLTIIVAALSTFIRRQSRIGFGLTLLAIIFFVVMTGAPASIVRAAVMTILFLVVGRTRRELDPKVALAVSLMLMTVWDPTYMYRDLGWQLSVLALAGVLYLSPFFMPRRGSVKTWRQLTAATLGATIATAPLLAYTFGSFAVIAPLANLLVLPLIPLVMLVGFISALTGVLLPSGLSFLITPISWLIQGLIWVIQSLSQIFWASLSVQAFSFEDLFLTYLGLAGIVAFSAVPRRQPIKKSALQTKLITVSEPVVPGV